MSNTNKPQGIESLSLAHLDYMAHGPSPAELADAMLGRSNQLVRLPANSLDDKCSSLIISMHIENLLGYVKGDHKLSLRQVKVHLALIESHVDNLINTYGIETVRNEFVEIFPTFYDMISKVSNII